MGIEKATAMGLSLMGVIVVLGGEDSSEWWIWNGDVG